MPPSTDLEDMHSIERKTCVPHPPAEPWNIKSEIFSDFVPLEPPKDFNPPLTSVTSSPLSSCSSAGDSKTGLKSGQVFTHVLRCDYFYL